MEKVNKLKSERDEKEAILSALLEKSPEDLCVFPWHRLPVCAPINCQAEMHRPVHYN
jgi:hypothetical protein